FKGSRREKMARRLWEFGIILMILAATTVIVGVVIIAIGMIFQEISSLSLTEILTAIIWPVQLNGWLGWLMYVVWWLFLAGFGVTILSGIVGLLKPKRRMPVKTSIEPISPPEDLKVVVTIPAYNEEETIADVIEGCKNYASEIFVIDDGSTDKTREIAQLAGVKMIIHKMNRGLSETIQDGFRAALNVGADIIINIDADGQYLAEEIPKLISPIIRDEADFVLGSRFAGHIEEMPWIKRFGNKLFTRVVRTLTNTEISDGQTGFRAFNRAAAMASINLAGRYTYTQEQIIRLIEEGFRVAEVPIYFAKRQSGSSRLIASPLGYGAKAFAVTLRTYRDYHPVLFFGILGGILIIAGLLLGSFVIIEWITTGLVFHESTAVLAAVFVMSGFQFLFFGFLADMFANLKRLIKRNNENNT
ncbi:MAG: glycosyltransferase family 2 protein, partial [Candidatus Sifarchaeia archaeon]